MHDEVGYNYRMTNVQASLGLAQLERLEGFIAHKKALYDRYVAALDGVKGLRILPFREGECRSNHWFFSLYLKDSGLDRDTVIEKLQAQHIQTRPVWALIHEQADYPPQRGLRSGQGAGLPQVYCQPALLHEPVL